MGNKDKLKLNPIRKDVQEVLNFSQQRPQPPRVHQLYLGTDPNGKHQYFSNHPGDTIAAALIGRKGSGKTRDMISFVKQLMKKPYNKLIVVIDHKPVGQRDLYDEALALAVAQKFEDQLYFFDPTVERVLAYNPLRFVTNKKIDYDHQVKHRADQVLSAQLSAWGQADALASPMIQEWGQMVGWTLTSMGLCLTEADELCGSNPKDLIRKAIINRLADDKLKRRWRELLSLKRKDQIEDRISPYRRRINQFIFNHYVRTMMGDHTKTLRLEELVRDGGVLNISIPSDVFEETDAKLMARLLLSQLVQTSMNRRDTTMPVFIFIDEGSMALSPDIPKLLDRGRSSNTHLFIGFQYLHQMVNEDDSGASAATFFSLMANTNLSLLYPGITKKDLDIMTSTLSLSSLDPYRVKYQRFDIQAIPVKQTVTEERFEESDDISSKHSHRETERSNIDVIRRFDVSVEEDKQIHGGKTLITEREFNAHVDRRSKGKSQTDAVVPIASASDIEQTLVPDFLLTEKRTTKGKQESEGEDTIAGSERSVTRIVQEDELHEKKRAGMSIEVHDKASPEITEGDEQSTTKQQKRTVITRPDTDHVYLIKEGVREYMQLAEQEFELQQKIYKQARLVRTVRRYEKQLEQLKAPYVSLTKIASDELARVREERPKQASCYTTKDEAAQSRQKRLEELVNNPVDRDEKPSDDEEGEEEWRGDISG